MTHFAEDVLRCGTMVLGIRIHKLHLKQDNRIFPSKSHKRLRKHVVLISLVYYRLRYVMFCIDYDAMI